MGSHAIARRQVAHITAPHFSSRREFLMDLLHDSLIDRSTQRVHLSVQVEWKFRHFIDHRNRHPRKQSKVEESPVTENCRLVTAPRYPIAPMDEQPTAHRRTDVVRPGRRPRNLYRFAEFRLELVKTDSGAHGQFVDKRPLLFRTVLDGLEVLVALTLGVSACRSVKDKQVVEHVPLVGGRVSLAIPTKSDYILQIGADTVCEASLVVLCHFIFLQNAPLE